MDLYAFRLRDGHGVVVIFDDPSGRLLDRQQVWRRLPDDAQAVNAGVVALNEVAQLRAELQALQPGADVDARSPILFTNVLGDPLVSSNHRGRATFVYRDSFPMIAATEPALRLRVDAAFQRI